jgi:hypothetical protein
VDTCQTLPSQSPVVQQWSDLFPVNAPQFADSYAHLSATQVNQLALLARIRWLLDTGRDSPDGVSAQEAQRIRQAFAAVGLDADGLLAQREGVRQRRIQQSYNAAVDGQPVKLMGIVLPLTWDRNNQFTQFLFASEWSHCSHEPPPPHHQVIYVESPTPILIDQVPHGVYQGMKELCLWVKGTLRFAASAHTVFRGDGMMRAEASYVIEPTAIAHPSAAELYALLTASRQQAEALLCPKLIDLFS